MIWTGKGFLNAQNENYFRNALVEAQPTIVDFKNPELFR